MCAKSWQTPRFFRNTSSIGVLTVVTFCIETKIAMNACRQVQRDPQRKAAEG